MNPVISYVYETRIDIHLKFNSIESVFANSNNTMNIINRIGIRWAGIAGDGLQSMGIMFAKYLNQLGYFAIGFPGTQSTIRGGHIWYHLEFSDEKFHFYDRTTDILVAFNEQALDVHLSDLKKKGILIINSDLINVLKFRSTISSREISVFEIPLTTITREIDKKLIILKNTIIVGFLIKLLNLHIEEYQNRIKLNFKGRNDLIDLNEIALMKGYSLLNSIFHADASYSVSADKIGEF